MATIKSAAVRNYENNCHAQLRNYQIEPMNSSKLAFERIRVYTNFKYQLPSRKITSSTGPSRIVIESVNHTTTLNNSDQFYSYPAKFQNKYQSLKAKKNTEI